MCWELSQVATTEQGENGGWEPSQKTCADEKSLFKKALPDTQMKHPEVLCSCCYNKHHDEKQEDRK